MQESKNKRRLIILITLIVITALAVWFNGRKPSAVVDPEYFRIAELDQIDKVVLRKGDDTVTLNFNGARWKVNDAWYADRNMIDVLFATLQQATPRRPVSVKERDSVQVGLAKDGVAVETYVKGTLTGNFTAGGNPSRTRAYFTKPGESEVFLMNIPGYRVYVSGIFELNESGWREKRVFAFNWQNFQKLEAQYPDRPKADFTIIMDDMQTSVSGITAADTARLNDFLDAVSLLTVDDYRESTPTLDSLLSIKPIQVLTVNDIGSKKFSLKIFPSNGPMVPGLINDTQWADFDGRKIRRIMVPKDFFIRN